MQRLLLVILLSLSAVLTGCGGSDSPSPLNVDQNGLTTFNVSQLNTQLNTYALGDLTPIETEGVLLMREEEKLAHDVYITLYNQHGLAIFNNIASSEQTHTDAMQALLERYQLDDPVTDTTVGVFTNSELAYLYTVLTENGAISVLEGLYVGARIEELDIYDLMRLSEDLTDNPDVLMVYNNLLKGSRNHLRSFYAQILNNNGTYRPQYISQALFDEIVNSPIEKG
ncbi:DUF2202 domain-containing protein [Alteromonas lipolytica]|uniref:DUF2202 domain-containing protein n=1 Tax=Alteromonas lipolytica TaxID=1856405 RepID=A0A1E8FD85_9ALTE|nr:DUF2202 domain-containing protein [Alteromonas lipolytica]OFI33890.1 hypothetical protein BFC17_20200 [Alteromonas lipolytica]GGF67497.1 hypothetical protein GCM10011338_19580 [Alteromonas lipolytica]